MANKTRKQTREDIELDKLLFETESVVKPQLRGRSPSWSGVVLWQWENMDFSKLKL